MKADTCGCCELPAATPITAFNRPGLTAIAFRVGTYSSFRLSMLQRIARAQALSALQTRSDDDYAITLLDMWATVTTPEFAQCRVQHTEDVLIVLTGALGLPITFGPTSTDPATAGELGLVSPGAFRIDALLSGDLTVFPAITNPPAGILGYLRSDWTPHSYAEFGAQQSEQRQEPVASGAFQRQSGAGLHACRGDGRWFPAPAWDRRVLHSGLSRHHTSVRLAVPIQR